MIEYTQADRERRTCGRHLKNNKKVSHLSDGSSGLWHVRHLKPAVHVKPV